ncbi:MAG TPA: two-component regulator propeller domain-containing protein, partial [Cyclobacteriaceae bacterium]
MSKLIANRLNLLLLRLCAFQTLLSFCCLALPKPVYSQPVSLINYSIREGLPSNEVYDIYQDKAGFIWFATDNGVVRFDGEEMKIFHIKDGLSDPVTFGFHEDYLGRLWFRSFSGKISHYDSHLNKIVPYKHSHVIEKFISTGGILNSLFVDSTTIWISTNFKLGQIDSLGHIKIQKLPPQSFTINEIKENFLLGFNPKNLVIDKVLINNDSFPITLTQTPLANHVVSSIRIKDELYFSVISDVFKYSRGKVTKVFASRTPVINLSKDAENNIWIGTMNKGVLKMNYLTGEVTQSEFLSDKSITKIFQDNDENFWFSTLENGIYFLPNQNIKILPPLTTSKIKAVTVYDNQVVVGDQSGYIHFMNNRKPLDFKSPIISFFTDFKNQLWISTNSEILILNKDLEIQTKLKHITKVGFSSDGKSIWGAGSISNKFSVDGEVLDTYHEGVY